MLECDGTLPPLKIWRRVGYITELHICAGAEKRVLLPSGGYDFSLGTVDAIMFYSD